MKNFKIYIMGMLLVFGSLTSCDEGFDELNTNKVDPTTLTPSFLMNNAIINTSFQDGFGTLVHLSYTFPIVQQIVTPFGSSLSGGNYNQNNVDNTARIWTTYYRTVVRDIVDVVQKTKDVEASVNTYHSARIWKAYVFQMLTDTYGDIPYFEAGKGFSENIITPKYDAQEVVYKDILKELDEATAALDASKAADPTDILYGGNVVKWKRFGYSLMLRAAMRLTKVDPTLAQTYVAKAVAGGVMQSNADNAATRHTALYVNWLADHLGAREKANYYLAAPFINYLRENSDPRLKAIAVRYVGAKSGSEQVNDRATTDPAKQVGMPMGYDNVTIAQTFAELGVASLWDFSQVNINTVLNRTAAPTYHVTHSQTQLLLAEAAVRGWITGDPATYFTNGITAHMEQFAEYGPNAAIPSADIQAYVQAHPLDVSTPEKALEGINTQYWVSSFLNGSELFANFRRSGYPALTPNPYPGKEITEEDFIRRLNYPDSEIVVNQANINEALTRQGPNKLDTRVWWDKKL
ncbi:SusD/RagB family nutrient-binding outer membrane lipoprotein [Adhaeribacter swui]|uniref:SusD/RagB family nutrient-binding outer membrane lipoprotein n=1 Tax=Adhaeribacter swui TaxID=2086471 RepID=A0A7G7G6M6_9BACT|nr:SusD/RagB family nutrient-binding outer membrane lipoprotein [Adhaeribacter swui]QNF32810.1 SusD/RagB family nutrient-binding outer membrane lipoprotein [Adhaeribacter swui]